MPLFAETPAQYRNRSVAVVASHSQLESLREDDVEMREGEDEQSLISSPLVLVQSLSADQFLCEYSARLRQQVIDQGFVAIDPSRMIVEGCAEPETQLINCVSSSLPFIPASYRRTDVPSLL